MKPEDKGGADGAIMILKEGERVRTSPPRYNTMQDRQREREGEMAAYKSESCSR